MLALGSAALVGVLARPARAQSPERGGTVTIRAWDPPHVDPFVTPGHNKDLEAVGIDARLNQKEYGAYVATDLLVRQRRTAEVAKRRELVNELQRYLVTRQHDLPLPSAIAVDVWDGALRNYDPNLGDDYGGRLQAAWLER